MGISFLIPWMLSYSLQILTKALNNAVMDTVDPEISETCKDLGEVKKVFQLALLCTKKQPSERPTMHEVARVLGTMMPLSNPKMLTPSAPGALPSTKGPCYMDEYANLKTPHLVHCSSMSTSDAQLFLKFGEVISQNTSWSYLQAGKKKKKKRKGTLALLKESRAKHEILYTDVLPINYALKKWTGSLPPSRSNSIDILSTVSSMVEDHCHWI